MKLLTTKILDSYKPCYPASRYYSKDWSGTVIDIMKDNRIPSRDRFWATLRKDLVSEKLALLFAIWCARQVRQNHQDKELKDVLDVVEKYCVGEASSADLKAAQSAAESITKYPVWSVSWDADSCVIWAVEAAASSYGVSFWHAIRNVIHYADRSEARSAATRTAQEKQLIAMLEAGIHTGDVK